MRVFLDNTRSALSPHGGVGHVGVDFFLALKRHGSAFAPTFLYRRGAPAENLAYLRRRGCTPLSAFHPRWSLHLPLRAHILHATYHRVSPLPFRARVLHVHDVWTLRRNPYQSPEFQERRAERFRRELARATHFTTMTRTVKDELVAEAGIDPERVSVVGYGAPRDLMPHSAPAGAVPVGAGTPADPFVVAVARVEVRKNPEHIVRAVRAVPGLRLVWVGGLGYQGEALAEEHLEPLRREGRLDWRPSVERDVLDDLYRDALALLSPSWEEGFGIPLLEAMAHGTPVITSDRSANAEVVAEGGALVDPARYEASVAWLERLRDDPGVREDLRRRALARAADFSWPDVAARLEAVYRASL